MNFFEKIYQKILSPYHYFWALFSALVFGFPSKKIKVIGITGTKGKSTVVEFTEKIFEEAGYKVASFSSIKIKIGKKEKKNLFKMTMPGRWYIQKFLKDAIKSKCDYAILEVTSEGILQHRQKFINFEVAVFTNLSKEHIERHGSFENYRASKGKLFKENSNIHILNLDDKNVDYFLKFQAKKKIGFTLKENYKQKENIKIIQGRTLKEKDEKFEFQVNDTIFKLNLVGDFNVYNALASICIGLSQNIPLETSKKAIEKVKKVEGRMEIVIEKPFEVIVDYAHTPDSLEAVYKNLIQKKEEKENSRLICVLGAAGGGRDKWKRPKMGEIAGNYCDKIILTDEDPYDENPKEILNDIFSGIKKEQRKRVKKILNRKKAIKKALSLAKNNDIVIITGKGCEPWMCVKGGKKIPWDDRKIVKEILKNKIN